LKILLDTCAFLWLNAKPALVPEAARAVCADPESELYLSVISGWEIAVKYASGRLHLPEAPARYVPRGRFQIRAETLPLTEEAVLQVPKLPPIHKDPFDRILICQALTHGLAILTPDPHFARYPVRILW
jgi:PIN domain nuclease of toxin-antitoxin system